MNKNYEIKYMPSFSEEIIEILLYINHKLNNKKAAENLYENVIDAILERSQNPTSFEIYRVSKILTKDWYRIYVKNYTIFYSVENSIMTVAHILYSKRDLTKFI